MLKVAIRFSIDNFIRDMREVGIQVRFDRMDLIEQLISGAICAIFAYMDDDMWLSSDLKEMDIYEHIDNEAIEYLSVDPDTFYDLVYRIHEHIYEQISSLPGDYILTNPEHVHARIGTGLVDVCLVKKYI
jgi:hypothetical protein